MLLIDLNELMKYPIRFDHYDKENGSFKFVCGVESVLEYAQSLPTIELNSSAHTNPEDTYREDFGQHTIKVGDLDCDDLVYWTCKPSNRPVDERNEGEPINVSTEIKHGLKWSCELEDCSFSPNMTRHFDSIESAEKYADGVLTKGIAKGVTIRRLEW